MPYIEEENGILNNFAKEPQMYTAEQPDSSEKRNYAIFGVLAFLLVAGIVAVAVYASGVS
jgi:hypothetical protein